MKRHFNSREHIFRGFFYFILFYVKISNISRHIGKILFRICRLQERSSRETSNNCFHSQTFEVFVCKGILLFVALNRILRKY